MATAEGSHDQTGAAGEGLHHEPQGHAKDTRKNR